MKVFDKKNIPQNKKIIVISPHPDDLAICVGGTVSALSKTNKVYNFVMTSGYRGVGGGRKKEEKKKMREVECRRESKILGAKPTFLKLKFYESYNALLQQDIEKVEKLFKKIKPNIIMLPKEGDEHPAHKTSTNITKKAVKVCKQVELWFYETPWSLFSNNEFNAIFPFAQEHMNKKLKAVKVHKSQTKRTRFDTAAKALAELRGATIPEQALAGFGKKTPKLPKYIELYKISSII